MVDLPMPVSDLHAREFAEHMQELTGEAKRCMGAAQYRMRAHSNKGRREVVYKPGDQVLLSTTNLKPAKGIKKLMPKFLGPFMVQHMVGKAAVKLALADGYERLHNVFHVSLVKPWKARPEQVPVPVPPVPLLWEGGLPICGIEKVLNHRCVPLVLNGQEVPGHLKITEYEVQWQGASETEWEPAGVLDPLDEAIAVYKMAHNLTGAEFS